MSHSPSSAGRGPPSSPYAGTDLTSYSPETGRKGRTQPASGPALSAKALGKRPVDDIKKTVKTVIRGIEYHGLHPQPHPLGTFLDELSSGNANFISRYLFISAIPDGIVAGQDHEMELYHVQHQMKLYQVFAMCVPIYERGVHLRFDNIRDACEAKLLMESRCFELDFIDNYDFAIAKSQDTAAIDEFEAQIKLVVAVEPASPPHHYAQPASVPVFGIRDLLWLGSSIEAAMTVFGTVRAAVHTSTNESKMCFTFRIEFHSAEAAARAVASLKKDPIWDIGFDASFHWSTVEVAGWVGPRPPNSPHRRRPRIDDEGRLTEFRHLPRTNANACQNSNGKHPADAHNRVRREHIIDGTDVRTTIMLRNIPNKLDWMTLKALLDQVCFGTYDFMYLRIDFKSGHNVGYAFVNFADVSGMIAMLDKVENRGWVGYRSSKNAEISYATIQGREALVQKFRNSSVMQETPYCRPRLFITYTDAMEIGHPRVTSVQHPFPSPDNLSKLQRSMDSARSIGLFPPSGSANAASQRFVSGYDRGGPRDMIHAANINGQYGTSPVISIMSEHKKRDCEQWYALNYGTCMNGIVPFAHIPLSCVNEFMNTHGRSTTVTINSPGVIGRPVSGVRATAHSGLSPVAPAFGISPAVPAYGGPPSPNRAYGFGARGHVFAPRTPNGQAPGSHAGSTRPASGGQVFGNWHGGRSESARDNGSPRRRY